MRSRLPLFVAVGFFAVILLAWWLWPREQEMLQQTSPASETLRAGKPTPASRPADVASMDEREETTSEAHDDPENAPAPTADLLLYAERPMSAVPHRVTRAWGASDAGSHLGLVGAYLIVEPGISDEQLIELCRDIRKYHESANALSVRILDSEEAATYDRDIDGGALKQQHQVATVTRDPKLGVDAIHVRGELVKP